MNEQALQKQDKFTEFVPFGAKDKVRLSVEIVKRLVAVQTKSGKTCSDKDAIKFIALCQAKGLNPFEGDAYLIGYDSKDGIATFSLITAHQAFLKRAELHPEYDGMKSGVIVQNEDQTLQDLEGDFYVDGQIVVGGWATVFFKTRKTPTHRRLRLKRFQKPWGVWQEDPGGMICKCAEADALRSSFPTLLGGLHLREEIDLPIATVSSSAPEIDTSRLVEVGNGETPTQPTTAEQPANGNQGREELAQFVTSEGFTFDHFQRWAASSGNIQDADSLPGWEAVKEADAKRLLRAKKGLLTGLAVAKGGG